MDLKRLHVCRCHAEDAVRGLLFKVTSGGQGIQDTDSSVWDLPEVLQFPTIHMVLNSVQQFFTLFTPDINIRLCDLTTSGQARPFLLVTQTLISKSYSMTTCLDFKGTFSDFEITYVIVLLVDKKKTNKQQWVNCSIFYCLNCFPLHLVWTIWIGSLTKCCPCSS